MRVSIWWAIGALALLVAGTCTAVGAHLDRQGAEREARDAKAAAEIVKAEYAEKAMQLGKKDTVYRTAKARVDSLRDTIPLWRHDTTYIIAYVERTDAALNACTELANSCAVFRVAADSTIRAIEREREAYHRLYQSAKPSRWDRAKPWLAGAAGFWIGSQLRVP